MRPVPRSRPACLPPLLLLAAACAANPSQEPPEPATTADAGADPRQIDPEEAERLRALGYVNFAPPLSDEEQVGVVLHDPQRASAGVNFFTNASICSAQLMGMDGQVYRTWSQKPCFRWGNAILLRSGDLLVEWRVPQRGSTSMDRYLLRMSWDGDVVWKKALPVHHDADITPDGRILVLSLTSEPEALPGADSELAVRDNRLTLLDMDGNVLEEVPVWELLHSAPDVFTPRGDLPFRTGGGVLRNPRQLSPSAPDEGAAEDERGAEGPEIDLIHANTVEWMRWPQLAGKHPIYDPGNVLFCMRNQDSLAIMSWKTRKLVWAWGQGEVSGPHDATVLPSGNILAFDNGLGRDWSRVIELDPLRREIVWEYAAPDRASFYSRARGANQRLANGNTLITESDDGRAFEVTPDGTLVWSFVNSNITDKREPVVIVRMRRFEGFDYEDLARRVESGQGLPFVVD